MTNNHDLLQPKKIIHIDMDCFFAAVEIRDNPALKNKPVAIGSTAAQRGVLSTCNYVARKYGLHSAMPTSQAVKLCPKLILLPVNMEKYKAASKVIYRIFRQYTSLVEMLSLDEAFLDVTDSKHCQGSATLIAQTIKNRIKKELKLTASAGVAPNKFLAKVASDWHKPDGIFVITPSQIDDFVKELPITKIFGVGKVTAATMHAMHIQTCSDLQELSLEQLTKQFGKTGERFYDFCRGTDHRVVDPEVIRKSLSIEETFIKDLSTTEECALALALLIPKFKNRLARISKPITKQFIKIKFCDFKSTTVEVINKELNEQVFYNLLTTGFSRYNKPVRLLGIGVRF
jgi:DNA polymerase-4